MPNTVGSIVNIEFEEGYLVLDRGQGNKTRYPVSAILRALDVPQLTHVQVRGVSALANLAVVLIRTLIARNILDESFLESGEYNLDDVLETIELMGGDFGNPELGMTDV